MSDLRELYQEVILDHSRNPRNFGRLENANHEADGHNPLCGDQITLYVSTTDGMVTDISFEGSGCAISTASASLMTEVLKGKSIEDAQAIFDQFHAMVTGDPAGESSSGQSMGKLSVLAGVREFPVRVKCASLAWHTFKAAIEESEKPISTE
ncbi:Fe-S cluster assembly sulfur transfer protein SufU [Gemmatimonadota bacterium]